MPEKNQKNGDVLKNKSQIKANKQTPKKSSSVLTKPKTNKKPSENQISKSENKEIKSSSLKNKQTPTKINLSEDFNDYMIFDVFLYRELFMELRKQMDELSAKRNKGEKEYAEYDDAVYNITSNAATDAGAQDFIGFCYKKGFYDFCIMNYEKYMKWTILAAANGNAFSISKLQIYLTTAIDKVLEVEDQRVLIDFLDLNGDNYMMFISKMLCEEIVKILNISSENLIKMPEKYMEQSEEVQKIFDKAKIEAAEIVSEKIKKSINALNEEFERQQKKEEESRMALLQSQETISTSQELKENKDNIGKDINVNEKKEESENKFKRNLKIRKKFRY